MARSVRIAEHRVEGVAAGRHDVGRRVGRSADVAAVWHPEAAVQVSLQVGRDGVQGVEHVVDLAVDGLNNVYILDGWVGKPAIYRYNLDGKFLNRFGSKGKEPGQFDAFNDLLALDGKSRLYVKDWNNLFVFDADGRYLNTIDGGIYGNSLYDVAINNITNEIWVVGYQNKVHKLLINEAK